MMQHPSPENRRLQPTSPEHTEDAFVLCQAPNQPPRREPVDLLYKRRFPLFVEPCILTRFRNGTAQFLPPARITNCPDLRTISNA